MNATEEANNILEALKLLANPTYKDGMQRFGIESSKALGVKIPDVRFIARSYKKQHELALALWDTGIHEARIMACLVADPKQFTSELMDIWSSDFDSWDVCDQCCSNLFCKLPFAYDKIFEYAQAEAEFKKRTAFTLIATMGVHLKKMPDAQFLPLLELLERHADDNRNFVKKAVNWALRQVGKRNATLRPIAIETARRIAEQPHKSARWIAADALRELEG